MTVLVLTRPTDATPQGRWYLIDVNPNGQWGFIPDLRTPITRALADLLERAHP
ncbi:hypothetical protein [Streptomyces sp. NPDC059455]|uniref:hypothetical protein n=1 Tax=Streptomyces sp. NPDC059455 TaxID=3346837 RepID=UPI0036913825